MSCVWMLQRGHSGDGCVLASTLCKYDLRKGDLFVPSWARVRRVRRGSISSELLVTMTMTMTMTKFILKFKTSLMYIRDTSMYKYNNNYSKNK